MNFTASFRIYASSHGLTDIGTREIIRKALAPDVLRRYDAGEPVVLAHRIQYHSTRVDDEVCSNQEADSFYEN
jgi:hypothetical protein